MLVYSFDRKINNYWLYVYLSKEKKMYIWLINNLQEINTCKEYLRSSNQNKKEKCSYGIVILSNLISYSLQS